MNKNELRKQMLNKRKSISNKKELSTIIMDKIINLDIYKKAKVIALFKSMKNEVDTTYLIDYSLKDKIVLLPKIIDNEIVFIKVNKGTSFVKSKFNVLEPIGDDYHGKIDLIIVPGVCFDKDNNRLGYGKGYYDKYLNNKNIYKIGICFNEQLTSHIITNKHDIKMDQVITEKEF